MAPSSNTPATSTAGFINTRHLTSRVQKVSWKAENDVKLLQFGFEREIMPREYEAIAFSFPEQPTAKAVSERLAKLRKEQLSLLKKHGVLAEDGTPILPQKRKRVEAEDGGDWEGATKKRRASI